ncbi:MAG: fibronectin type III domain-containing protein [Flavisolibacter sp.]|jgi:hypothetical protein
MKRLLCYLLVAVFFTLFGNGIKSVQAQDEQARMFDPNDPVVIYDPANPPELPPAGEVGKWVKTNRLSWNTSSFKCYIYKGIPFRLKYPLNYDTTKTYPLYVFFHGRGEYGTIYDNEYSMAHGGQVHRDAVDKGKFNGFLLYPQNQTGGWSSTYLTIVDQLIENFLIPQAKVDPFRIFVNGLSAGGSATWSFSIKYIKLVAAFTPISSSTSSYINGVQNYKYTPIWHFQGGLDVAPTPGTSRNLGNNILAAGGNYKYTEYPNRGHDCWNQAWAEPDYFPFYNRAHKANPWPSNGRFEFCPGDPVRDTLGVTPGFEGYEWRKDGVLIPGANSNTYIATALGTYDCRIKRGTTWSVWSPTPAVLKLKTVTISPNITVSGLTSNVIPSLDGSTSAQLEVPEGYVAYNWQKDGNSTTLSTTRFLTTSTPGNYKVKVTERFGCSSEFSPLFPVINANGDNGPAPAAGLIVTPISKTAIQLNWSQNSNPLFNETAFEVYQASQLNGPYQLVAVTPADATGVAINDLSSGTKYFYKVRAVNNNAAAPATEPDSATTLADVTPPTAPGNLRVTFVTRNSVELVWEPSTDDVEVTKYDVYINGIKTYVTESTIFTVYNLTPNKTYNFTVRARDFADNNSPFSNQATASTIFTGLSYKFYTGSWNALPDFNALSPAGTGFMRNVDITSKSGTDNFGFLWEGFIKIPVNGSYTFRTNSDDGSKLYLSTYGFNKTALVNNDGAHGTQDADGTITLNAGVYPISIVYFEKTGGESMTVSWKTPQTGNNFVKIPDSVFTEAPIINGQPPARPSNLSATTASYNRINLSWTDNSNNETGFEILRSTDRFSGFSAIVKTAPNVTTYKDTLPFPDTIYYYRIRAINQYGESAFDKDEGNGVNYLYYEVSGLSSLPDFNTLTPVKAGRVATFGLGMQSRSNNFALKFDGFINISTAGTYTFSTISDAGSKLYIGGYNEANLVVNNDGVHGRVERFGSKTLAPGLYPVTVTYFVPARTASLNVNISGPGFTKQAIPVALLGTPFVNARTLALPGMPIAPDNLVASAVSPTTANLTWNDNATNEESYEVYRSSNGNSNFIRIETLPENTTSYVDSNLFANSVFYYKVKAVNVGGSASSNEDSAKTTNNLPVITAIDNQFMRYGTQLQLPFFAADQDPESLTIDFGGTLPAFATFTPDGNGKGTLSFNPQQANQGNYIINVSVTDQNGGTANASFQLTVNDNYNPVIGTVNNITLNEKQSAQIALTATDQNASNQLTWSFDGLPSFASVNTNGGNVQINLTPGYTDADTYVVKARVEDGNNGFDTASFVITVNDVDVNRKFYINFNKGYNVTGVWNNLDMAPALNASRTGFKDDRGNVSTVGMKVMSDWAANGSSHGTGAVTGDDSGIYPDLVMKTGWYSGKIKQTFQYNGLNPSLAYNFIFFGSKNVTTDKSAIYTINGTSVTLNAANNTTHTVSINGVFPDANGIITINMQNAPTSSYAYLNAMVVESRYDDGTTPANPTKLSGVFENGKVQLTWKDVAYNENAYEVYRSSDANTGFVLLATKGDNTSSYSDSDVVANRTYYYKVRAIGSNGNSDYSAVAEVIVPNLAPELNGVTDQNLKNGQTATLNIVASDDPADVLTISASNLPSFAALTDNGNGTATLVMNPQISDLGSYSNINIAAVDNHGAVTEKSFTINVTNNDLGSIYVNFNSTLPEPLPWNSFNASPRAGTSLNNLKDEAGASTGVNITLVDAWKGANSAGAITGTNTGVFPDNVMKTYYYESTTSVRRLLLSGLSSSKKYNIVLFPGYSKSGTILTNYTIGGQTITVNAAGNTSKVAKFNGLSPDANGQITISVAKDPASTYAFINAMVIQYYDNGLLLAPVNLTATGVSKSQINLKWSDNSEETGFEIWRSTSANGSYSLVTTTAANVTSYNDGGLAENTTYYYKIRAKAGANVSSYSNIASSSTFSYVVEINFNLDNPAASPWNNTNSLPEQFAFYQNLINDQGNPSGLDMTIVDNFSGINPDGMNTGNNSGVYPDNVMRSSYYLGKGVSATLRIDGLSQTNEYNFVFFGSRNGGGDRTTIYTIGDQSVSLNASYNTSNTVQISHVKPDENGSVFIKSSLGAIAQFGYFNSLVIQGYSTIPADNNDNNNFITKINSDGTNTIGVIASVAKSETKEQLSETAIKVYPNPFQNSVTIKLSLPQQSPALFIKIADMSGRIVGTQEFKNVAKGEWQQQINLDKTIKPGMYLLYIEGLPNEQRRVVKLLKMK